MNQKVGLFDTLEEFISYATKFPKSKFLLCFGENFTFSSKALFDQKIEYYASLHPFIIYNYEKYEDKMFCIVLDDIAEIELVEDISSYDSQGKLDNLKSIIVFADALSNSLSRFLENLYEHTALGVNIIGGGSGKKRFIEDDVIFYKDKPLKNAAIIVKFFEKIHHDVKHGWEYLDGPFVITSSKDDVINEIDFKDAIDFYKTTLEKDLDKKIDDSELLDLSRSYPLGIVQYKQEFTVRDMISFEHNKINLIGSIIENSLINILKGNKDTLIESTTQSAKELKGMISDFDTAFIFDCISREEYLEDSYKENLLKLKKELDSNIIGVGTLGEFANDGTSYIDILNKTCVLGASRCF